MSKLMFYVNQPPEGGTCLVDPMRGVTLADKFGIYCELWDDPEEIGIKKYKISGKRFFFIISCCVKVTIVCY